MVGVAGGSGSGKTTFCRALERLVGKRAVTLSSDNYYRPLDHLSPVERDAVNFDHPDAIDFAMMANHLTLLSEGQSVSIPNYDFAKHTRRPTTFALDPTPIMLVEGILLFAPVEIRTQLDLLVFVHADPATRLQRRLRRDTQERGRSDPSVREQWEKTVQPMHVQHVEPTRRFAQIVVNTGEDAQSQVDVVAILASGILKLT